MQSACCTYEKEIGHKGTPGDACTEQQRDTVIREVRSPASPERGLRGNQAWGHLDLGQLTSRTTEQTLLLFKSPACSIS